MWRMRRVKALIWVRGEQDNVHRRLELKFMHKTIFFSPGTWDLCWEREVGVEDTPSPWVISLLTSKIMSDYSLASHAAQLAPRPYRHLRCQNSSFPECQTLSTAALTTPFRSLDPSIMSKSIELTYHRQTPVCCVHLQASKTTSSTTSDSQGAGWCAR